jgi:hypothetical protein
MLESFRILFIYKCLSDLPKFFEYLIFRLRCRALLWFSLEGSWDSLPKELSISCIKNNEMSDKEKLVVSCCQRLETKLSIVKEINKLLCCRYNSIQGASRSELFEVVQCIFESVA